MEHVVMTLDLPFGDDLPYWKTSKSPADSWVEKTIELLRKLGATEISEAFASSGGVSSFVIVFRAAGELFRVVWPVLRVRKPEDEKAARVQAATLMYHDCKAKAVAAKALGFRTAFIGQLVLPNNCTVQESAQPMIAQHVKPVALIGQSS
jgi:hypothetical protein